MRHSSSRISTAIKHCVYICYSFTDLSVGIMQPLVVGLPEVNNVDVSLVDRLDVALVGVHPHGHGAVDAGHSDAVTGLNTIDL